MPNPAHLDLLKKGVGEWNSWRAVGGSAEPDLSGADLRSLALAGVMLRGAILDNAQLDEAVLDGAILQKVSAQGTSFEGAKLRAAQLDGSTCIGARFSRADLTSVDATGAKLDRADLTGADLRDTSLRGASLLDANLEGATVNGHTHFLDAEVAGCRVERYTLERLDNYGGLTRGRMMTMRIVDPVAELRSYYSGFWQWIHVVALTLFVAPYVVFLAKKYTVARFLDVTNAAGSTTITVAEALGRYIWTGGAGEHFAPTLFAIFCFSLLYNALRLVLLFKTKQLELRQNASGLPVIFSLKGPWGSALQTAHVLFFVNVGLVLYHTWHFLQMRVPR